MQYSQKIRQSSGGGGGRSRSSSTSQQTRIKQQRPRSTFHNKLQKFLQEHYHFIRRGIPSPLGDNQDHKVQGRLQLLEKLFRVEHLLR